MKKATKKMVFLSGIGILMVSTLAISLNTDLHVVHYSVKSNKISRPVKIALITDLHSCDYGENQSELIDELFRQSPDLVLLGGDIVDDKLPQDKAKEFLSAVSQSFPCFYVTGNHELWSRNADQIKMMIEGYGIPVLEGESVSFAANGEYITICGVDDPDIGVEQFEQQLQNCQEHLEPEQFSILLAHRPERIDRYCQGGFDLVLSGHAHGGQWRIPGVLNGLLAPNQGLFPQYAGGMYELEKTHMIVSRGLARESTRVPRIFNRPELVVVELAPESNMPSTADKTMTQDGKIGV